MIENWISTVLTMILGSLLTVITSWVSERRIAERERIRQRQDRNEKENIWRREFKRETLLALQVSSQKLLRASAAILHKDEIANRTNGEWQRQQLPERLSDEHLYHLTDTMLLASRVSDIEIRTSADRLRELASAIVRSATEVQAQAQLAIAVETQASLFEKIGCALRDADGADAFTFAR